MSTLQNTKARVTEDYVILHRKLTEEVRNGDLSVTEYLFYVWLKNNANPYAKVTVNLTGLNDDLFYSEKTDNYINKILLSLKKKQYIDYTTRKGCKGSFTIILHDFLLPQKVLTNLRKETIVSQTFESTNQTLKTTITYTPQEAFTLPAFEIVRGDNNDNNKKNNNYKNNHKSYKTLTTKEIVRTDLFKPKDEEELLCKQINLELGDSDMKYILKLKSEHGIETVKQSYNRFKDRLTDTIKNKPAFFNYISQEIIKEKE